MSECKAVGADAELCCWVCLQSAGECLKMSSSRGCQAALRFSPALFEAQPERQTDLIFLPWQFSKSGLKIET